MTSLKKSWQRLSAKKQVFLHAAAVLLLLFLCYAFLGSPAFTVRSAFHRAEKAAMTGPSEILGKLEHPNYPFDALVAARDQDAVVLFAYDRKDPARSELVYRKKAGQIAVLAAPGDTLLQFETSAVVPLAVFHDRADGFRAELELTLQTGSFEKVYHLSSDQTETGCFFFLLEAVNAPNLGDEGIALGLLQEICSNSMAGNLDVAFPATVRIYDRAGTLILEEDSTIRSAAAQDQP